MTDTVIIGTGIIGLSVAYYLSHHHPPSSIHLIDASTSLFASASGYAGGFLAKDWFPPTLTPLGILSFEEHAKLAAAHGGDEKWGYARSVTVSYDPRGKRKDGRRGEDWLLEGTSRAELVRDREGEVGKGDVPGWLRRVDGDSASVVDNGDGTAIVDPLKLCEFLLKRVISAGVHVHNPATVSSLMTNPENNELSGVRITCTKSFTTTEIPCTRLLISAGAWTPTVLSQLLPESDVEPRISSLAGHSIVVKTPVVEEGEEEDAEDKMFHSVYCSLDDLSPEMYARRNGVIYIAGLNSRDIPLPVTATDSQPMEESLSELRSIAAQLVSSSEQLEVVRSGLCFRPISERGTPYIVRLPDERLGGGLVTREGADGGVYLAAGHGPWGISLALGTGRVVSEMMMGREVSVDVSGLGV